MMRRKILLVEDDNNLGAIVTEYLGVKGFDVVHCLNGEEGLNKFRQKEFDLCIIDVMMPKLDGFSFAKKIGKGSVPFIFLTAKSMLNDKIDGFNLGADDYITKPFSMEELILRINAILKRSFRINDVNETNEFNIGMYTFKYDKRILVLKGKEQKLTSKEAELLKLLYMNKNNLMERSTALLRIWKDESYFTSRSMDVYIAKLRSYLKNDPKIQIVNVHGSGFKILVD